MPRNMFSALMKKFISQPERMGAPTQSRNILGIKHPLAESSPVARIPISMIPGGGPGSGYTQEDLATLKLPEETTLFSPLGYDITDKDLAKVGLATDAMDLLPGAAIVGGMATSAGRLGRALKGKDYAPTSTEDIASALLAPSLQRQGALDDAMVTYQGSPHKFDALDPSKIGTGENAQAFGHGMYVAENRGVAGGYRDALSTISIDGRPIDDVINELPDSVMSLAKQRGITIEEAADIWDGGMRNEIAALSNLRTYGDVASAKSASSVGAAAKIDEMVESGRFQAEGYLYEIDVPDEDIAKMLDWDAPFDKQPEALKEYIRAFDEDEMQYLFEERYGINYIPEEMTGGELHRVLEVAYENDMIIPSSRLDKINWERSTTNKESAAIALEEAGIPGIKYYDQGSRGAEEGTRNMVLFDELARRAKVLKRNDEIIAQPSVDEFIGKLLED